MDITEIIRSKIASLPVNYDKTGLDSVLSHIAIAEEHFKKGVTNDIDYLFTDVVYRTNQAFEGGMREAFRVLSKRSDYRSVKMWKLEKFLIDNKIFNNRVTELFKNYRENWRNETTHNYDSVLSEEEALLAISSVSAFVSILVDQIRLNVAADEETKTEVKREHRPKDVSVGTSLLKRTEELLINFSYHFIEVNKAKNIDLNTVKEVDFIGQLCGFMANYGKGLQIEFESPITTPNGRKLWLDLMVKKGNKSVIVEIKRNRSKTSIQMGREQIQKYLSAANVKSGILYFMPTQSVNEITKENLINELNGEKYNLSIIK